MKNYLLRLSFVGTRYSGWQIQPGVPTVQGELTKVLEEVLGERVKVVGCCRTDAGVHAKDYVANFKSSKDFEEEKLLKALNSLLPKDIGVSEVRRVPEDFNARFSVKGKEYVYRIWTAPWRDPFLYPFSLHIPGGLEVKAVEEAMDVIRGKHDFSGFAKLEDEKNTVIELEAELEVRGHLIELRFRATHFLRHMVRRLSGALIWVGRGKMDPKELEKFLSGESFPYTAPPQGLTLEKVFL